MGTILAGQPGVPVGIYENQGTAGAEARSQTQTPKQRGIKLLEG